MSQKEVERELALSRYKQHQITLQQAAEEMLLSYPQAKRIWARYKKEGRKGLISRKRGIKSNRAVSIETRQMIIKIISEHYQGCKPLFISEKLEQHHGIKYSSEFIRQLMIEHCLWQPKVHKKKLHPRRPRREREGELLQVDASNHAWFEQRGPRCHLHLFIDDATSAIAGGWFAKEETTEGYYRALQPILERRGRPVNLYTDKRGTIVVNQGTGGQTQFARAMKELRINMITAHSPQAKGRIERTFGTLQDRLVWEMRIHNICTIEAANRFLPKFFQEHNNKYAKQPSSPFDAYRPLSQNMHLKYILSTKELRVVSKNLEVQYKGQIYQLSPNKKVSLKNARVLVITTLDGELAFEYQGHRIDYKLYGALECQQPEACSERLLANWHTSRNKRSNHHPGKRTSRVRVA